MEPVTEPTATRQEFASYVEALAGELARLARGHNLSTLAYILDMVRLEAREAAGRGDPEASKAEV